MVVMKSGGGIKIRFVQGIMRLVHLRGTESKKLVMDCYSQFKIVVVLVTLQ